MLSEINQTEKENTVWYHLYMKSKKAGPVETESRLMVARHWRMGKMERCYSKGTNFNYKSWVSNVQHGDYTK